MSSFKFIDIDECSIGTDYCSEHAYCTNTFGGHNCTCNDGYTGDGYYCSKFVCSKYDLGPSVSLYTVKLLQLMTLIPHEDKQSLSGRD